MPTVDTSRAAFGAGRLTVTSGLRWKLQRLRSMSPAEVAWRVGQRARLAAWTRRAGVPPPALPRPAEGFVAAFRKTSAPFVPGSGFAEALEGSLPGERARVRARAAAIRAGSVELFARTYALGPDPAAWPWNRDPAGGPEAPNDFGPTLDYRDPARVGDARLAWELGRHGCLVPLAQAAYLDRDAASARFAFEVLESFLRACPPYRGLQWASALEYALRSLSWGHALALIATSEVAQEIDEARWERVFAAWAEQLRFVRAHDARHSSANNHRLGEAAGLAVGGRLLGFLSEARDWHAHGLTVLEESFLAQTDASGVTREHAFAYQHFVLDFAVAAWGLEQRAGAEVPARVRERLAKVAAWLERVSPGGLTWPVGDGDEGQALPTGEPFEQRVSASLECAAGLVGKAWSGPRAARALWFGLAPVTGASAPPVPQVEGGGYVVAQRGEARVLFDAAELGLAPLYAHGHADALMLLLDVRGPRLVDAGTGGYHAHAALRERLRATAAHNTVEVGGVSQSSPGGLFQWLRAARVTGRRIAELDWSAAHDGYGVTHTRRVTWPEPGRLVVEDALEGAGAPRAVVRWHLGEGRASGNGGEFVAEWPDGFALTLSSDLRDGRAHADALWAPRFLEPRACGVVEWTVEGPLPKRWRTEIRWTT